MEARFSLFSILCPAFMGLEPWSDDEALSLLTDGVAVLFRYKRDSEGGFVGIGGGASLKSQDIIVAPSLFRRLSEGVDGPLSVLDLFLPSDGCMGQSSKDGDASHIDITGTVLA